MPLMEQAKRKEHRIVVGIGLEIQRKRMHILAWVSQIEFIFFQGLELLLEQEI